MATTAGATPPGDDPFGSTELPARVVLEMLRVRTSDAMPSWFAAELASFCAPSNPRVMRVFPGAAARSRSAPRYALFPVDEAARRGAGSPLVALDSMLLDAIHTARPWSLVHSDAGVRLVATLAAGGEVRYVIELTGRFEPRETRRVAATAAVASRYFERLVDAETDALTRLPNRRAFHTQLDGELRGWIASGRPWYFAMLDLDRFKRVNDDFGHLYGDEILVRFANLLRATFRTGDLCYRFGGEEFALLFGVEEASHALPTLERFRETVAAHEFPGVGQVTVSIGFTRMSDPAIPATTLIDRADQALYFAKGHGRNRSCEWEALVASGELAPVPPRKDVTLF